MSQVSGLDAKTEGLGYVVGNVLADVVGDELNARV
jgi:hypothetical protein